MLTLQPRASQARGRVHYGICTDHHATSVDACPSLCSDVLARLLPSHLATKEQKKKVGVEAFATNPVSTAAQPVSHHPAGNYCSCRHETAVPYSLLVNNGEHL